MGPQEDKDVSQLGRREEKVRSRKQPERDHVPWRKIASVSLEARREGQESRRGQGGVASDVRGGNAHRLQL